MDMSAEFLVRKRLEEEKVVPWKAPIIDIHLQYWPRDNILTDENGEVVFNIFSMITPNDLTMFKENPYWNEYFLHSDKRDTVVAISYKDPHYFEEGDYKRYPTIKSQMILREQELARFGDQLDDVDNFSFRRRIYPELYS